MILCYVISSFLALYGSICTMYVILYFICHTIVYYVLLYDMLLQYVILQFIISCLYFLMHNVIPNTPCFTVLYYMIVQVFSLA